MLLSPSTVARLRQTVDNAAEALAARGDPLFIAARDLHVPKAGADVYVAWQAVPLIRRSGIDGADAICGELVAALRTTVFDWPRWVAEADPRVPPALEALAQGAEDDVVAAISCYMSTATIDVHSKPDAWARAWHDEADPSEGAKMIVWLSCARKVCGL